MAIERVAVDVASGLPADVAAEVSASRLEAQDQLAQGDEDAAARRAAEKKLADKKDTLDDALSRRDAALRELGAGLRRNQVLGGGAAGRAAAGAPAGREPGDLRPNPAASGQAPSRDIAASAAERAAAAGRALERLTQDPVVHRAITSARQLEILRAAVHASPELAEAAASILRGPFPQLPRADEQVRARYLRFGLDQAAQGRVATAERAGRLLTSVAEGTGARGAQRAVMAMVERAPEDAGAAASVDSFVRHPAVRALPAFARGKATELLARAGGDGGVKDALERLAAEPGMGAGRAGERGRFFATIGSGSPGELRALTDHVLVTLRSPAFPRDNRRVGRLLRELGAQVHRGGAAAVDTGALLAAAHGSLPPAPELLPARGLDGEAAARASARNRGQILRYFNQLERLYDRGAHELAAARYLEDVNALETLREPPPVDTSALGPQELSIWQERSRAVSARRAEVLRLHKRRSRELRGSRMPLARRSAMLAARRAEGPQARYFHPAATGSDRLGAGGPHALSRPRAARPAPAEGAGRTPATAPPADLDAQVAAAVARLASGPITAARAAQLARAIATEVAQQVAERVTAELLARAGPSSTLASPAPAASTVERGASQLAASGRAPPVATDGWGVPQRLDRDVAGPPPVVKPTHPADGAPPTPEATRRRRVEHGRTARSLDALLVASDRWTELTRAEHALLRTLGWSGESWAARETPAALWPIEMATPYMDLSPAERDAVVRLGVSPSDWDERVRALGANGPRRT